MIKNFGPIIFTKIIIWDQNFKHFCEKKIGLACFQVSECPGQQILNLTQQYFLGCSTNLCASAQGIWTKHQAIFNEHTFVWSQNIEINSKGIIKNSHSGESSTTIVTSLQVSIFRWYFYLNKKVLVDWIEHIALVQTGCVQTKVFKLGILCAIDIFGG